MLFSPRALVCSVLLPLLVLLSPILSDPPGAQPADGDLDAFMARVLARRDDNWSRLQQYVLDERELVELRGPGNGLLYGRERELTWYIREGVFVRSPLRVDGAAVGEDERRKYEDEWLSREKHRKSHRQSDSTESASDAETLARLVREPRFVSAAYFLKFKFEPGRYAFVGPEDYNGRRVLRIEYYPARLFEDDDDETEAGDAAEARQERRIERQMNKVALVTVWVEPQSHQIVKYTFDNVGWDFLPGRWLVRIDEVRATMEMGQPFAGVWLPASIRGHGAVTLAAGTYDVRYLVEYHSYREAAVKTRVR